MRTKRDVNRCLLLLALLTAVALPAAAEEGLMDPSAFTEKAPDKFVAKFETSKGVFTIDITRESSPVGVDRFYNLVKSGYYNDQRFFRVVPGFVVQWGMHGDPKVTAAWRSANINDDQVKMGNEKGTICFAKSSAPNSRTTQVFINLRDNRRLDGMGFAAFGKVAEGMDVVEALYSGYGDGPPSGRGPRQHLIGAQGNAYLTAEFPELDYIKSATIVEAAAEEEKPATE